MFLRNKPCNEVSPGSCSLVGTNHSSRTASSYFFQTNPFSLSTNNVVRFLFLVSKRRCVSEKNSPLKKALTTLLGSSFSWAVLFFSECFFGTNHLFWVFLRNKACNEVSPGVFWRRVLFFKKSTISQRYNSSTLKNPLLYRFFLFQKEEGFLKRSNKRRRTIVSEEKKMVRFWRKEPLRRTPFISVFFCYYWFIVI